MALSRPVAFLVACPLACLVACPVRRRGARLRCVLVVARPGQVWAKGEPAA